MSLRFRVTSLPELSPLSADRPPPASTSDPGACLQLLHLVPTGGAVTHVDNDEDQRDDEGQDGPDGEHLARAEAIVQVTHDRARDRGREAARAADDREGEGATPREPLRRDAEHRGPPER